MSETTTVSPTPRRPFAAVAVHLTAFHAASWWNWRNSNLGRLVEPLIYFAFLCTSLRGVVTVEGGGDSYLRFSYVGMLGYVSLRVGIATLVDVANDRKWGVYAIARMDGRSAGAYLASLVAANLVLMAIQAAALLGLLALFAPTQVTPSVWSVTALALAGSVFWSMTGAVLAFGVSSYSRRDLISTLSLLPLALTAPIFYPTDVMPPVVRAMAYVNPLTYELDALRSALNGSSNVAATAAFLLATASMAALLSFVARRSPLVSGEVS
ncbi:ABC-2 type transport system permease protein [Couchioplanes caeruleus]|nr:ABC-2 type transport system permease protein [Couchioplanes caeruleus]